jgi:hypothetical protein
MTIYVSFMPVNYFTVTGRGNLLFSCPAPNGYSFFTAYIHSLERTPVLDNYRFVCGRLWGWEELTMSLNAGLPSVPMPGVKLVISPPWMITQGGRRAQSKMYYRVGNDVFGRNTWRIGPWNEINIFEKYPMQRLSLEVSAIPFRYSAIVGFDSGSE